MRPYYGITGITDASDFTAMTRFVSSGPAAPRIMAGLLVSSKTLLGERTERKAPPRFKLCDFGAKRGEDHALSCSAHPFAIEAA